MRDEEKPSTRIPIDKRQCPYCGVLLDKAPRRKKRCPACKQYIHCRTSPLDGKRYLVTKDEVRRIEAEWNKICQMGNLEKTSKHYRTWKDKQKDAVARVFVDARTVLLKHIIENNPEHKPSGQSNN